MTGVELEIAPVHQNTYCTLYRSASVVFGNYEADKQVSVKTTYRHKSIYKYLFWISHVRPPYKGTRKNFFILYIFRGFCVYLPLPPLRGQHTVLCHPRWLPTSGLTEFAVCWGGAGFEPRTTDLQSGALPLSHLSISIEPPLLLALSHLSSRKNYLLYSNGKRVNWSKISRCQGEKGECKGDSIMN